MIGDAEGFHRFGLGPRPGDLATYSDLRAAIHHEVEIGGIALLAGPELLDAGAALMALAEGYQEQQRRQAEMAEAARAGEAMADAVAMTEPEPPAMRDVPPQVLIYQTEIAARLRRFHAVGVGFVERLVAFWNNHFAIEAASSPLARTLVGEFEREAIRPHVLGSFRDMLGATTKHPAMLAYLDSAGSIGPNSPAGLRTGNGLNENHARELLELHTLGVDAGYTQADVTAMARILTGWTFVGRPGQDVPAGSFMFREDAHEPGTHTVLGVDYADTGVAQGEAVLDMLAEHPATARRVAFKLARHFVADDPPPELVGHLSQTFADTGGDLKAVSLALVDSDLAFADATKIKPPQLFAWSAMRALSLRLAPSQILPGLQALGQPMWDPPSPAGFNDESATWLAPDAMTNRLDIAQLFAERAEPAFSPDLLFEMILGPGASHDSRTTVLSAGSEAQALALLLMTPEFQRM